MNSDENLENSVENELPVMNFHDLSTDDRIALKGDTIGDTVYSAKWILNTLITLSKTHENGWSESLESNLCMLWDMTVEKDIVDFLMEHEFLRIAEFILKVCREPRLTEIIVGIIGNMCSQPATLEAVAKANNLVLGIFQLLSTDDTETLIQILRLLQAAVWCIQKNDETMWLPHLRDCEFLGDAISFMLMSSTNDDLLIAATDLLQSISVVQLPNETSLLSELFHIEALMPSLLEAFTELVPPRLDDIHSDTELKVIENWLTTFANILQLELELFSTDKSDNNFRKMMNVLLRILQPYKRPSNLAPLDERIALCIHESVEMIFWFQRNDMHPGAEIIHAIVSIMHGLRLAIRADAESDTFNDPDETIQQLSKFLERYWFETLSSYEEDYLLQVIEMCDNPVMKCLIEVTKEYSTESRDPVEKLLRVQSRR